MPEHLQMLCYAFTASLDAVQQLGTAPPAKEGAQAALRPDPMDEMIADLNRDSGGYCAELEREIRAALLPIPSLTVRVEMLFRRG